MSLAINPWGSPKTLLDPFAGVGGILFEAKSIFRHVFSGDLDPKLRYGLSQISDQHHSVLDAGFLPFRDNAFAAVVSELPFNKHLLDKIAFHLAAELSRVTLDQGKIVLMTIEEQAEALKTAFAMANVDLKFESYVNRKGTDVFVSVWQNG